MRQRPLYLLGKDLIFPPVQWARPDGLLAIGGDLSVPRLLLAYQSGIFPWPILEDEDATLLWWAPPERAIIEPTELHVGRSLRKLVRRQDFTIRFDTAFAEVIGACAAVPRPGQGGTWILPDMVEAYVKLYHAGFAHSVEAYQEGRLVGGLYGVSLGGCFFGESMFSVVDNASKVAFVALSERLASWSFDLIDCQIQNEHLVRFGVYKIPRAEFAARLRTSLQRPTRQGSWSHEDPDPQASAG
jgi:leucyl/phenylalanyl-tRNA--protein transferase